MATAPLSILTPDGYNAVRAAIDLSVDAAALPDAVIESMPFGPAAEAELLGREAQVLPSQIDPVKQAAHREQAAVYLTAARLAQQFPFITSQALGDSRYTRAAFDPAQRHASLRTLAEREMAAYLSPTGYPPVQPHFFLGWGRRGA